MKVISTLLLALTFSFTFSQTLPGIQAQKCFGGNDYDYAESVKQTTDGGYIIAGYTISANGDVTGNHGLYDYWIVRLGKQGNTLWQKALGGSDYDYAQSVQQTKDGGFIVAGYTTSNNGDVSGNHGLADFWIVKLSNNGTIQWQKALGGSNSERARSVQQTADGGYIIAGDTYSTNGDVSGNHGNLDYWVVKLYSTGDIQWQKTLGGSNYDYGQSVAQTRDGGFIVAGYSNSFNGDVSGNKGGYDYWIAKLTKDGTLQWQKNYGGNGDDNANSVQPTADGGYIVAGHTNSNDNDVSGNHGLNDFWILKLNASGVKQWAKTFGGSSNELAYSVQPTKDSGYVVSGYSSSNDGDVTGNHGSDYWVVKLNKSGSLQWQKTLGGSSYELAKSIYQTKDGGYVVAGEASSKDGDVTGNKGGSDDWIVKLAKDGSFISSLQQNDSNVQATAQQQNTRKDFIAYPNPAVESCTVFFTATQGTRYSIVVTDIAGKILQTITGVAIKGQNNVLINISKYEKGVHLVQLKDGKEGRMVKVVKE